MTCRPALPDGVFRRFAASGSIPPLSCSEIGGAFCPFSHDVFCLSPPLRGWGKAGFARLLRTVYSRTLCLPCLKAGFFCFLHYRCWPLYVQLFILNFLCICLSLFGTLFFSRSSFKSDLPVAFYQSGTNLHRGLTLAQQGGFAASLVSLPYLASKTAHRAARGQVWFFSPKLTHPSP